MEIKLVIDTGREVEVKVGSTFVWWKRSEFPTSFSVCREKTYVEMDWADLTLDEQKAVEKFN